MQDINGYMCGGTGGWRRAVYMDMTDPNTNCPSGWQLLTENSRQTCGRISRGELVCDSVFFPVSGGPYNQVCGRIRGYQKGLTSAFLGYSRYGQTTIDSAYVSGVAVMHGSPRQHIWTFAAGGRENFTASLNNCPCDPPARTSVPPFVREDYFCESGYLWPGHSFSLSTADVLWDGRDCPPISTCCSHHNPPYFTKLLDQTTTDDLELRMCVFGRISRNENIPVELVELYVKQDYVQTTLQEVDNELKKSFVSQTNSISNLHVHSCGGTEGWRRAVYLDMTDPSTNCPPGWNVTGYSKRTCGRANSSRYSCDSVFFPVSGGQYSQVCGRIRAYQWGLPEALAGHRRGFPTIDVAYFDGVAVMHGSPRQHIWTFVAGGYENWTSLVSQSCPCDVGNRYSWPPPSFVGNDYFCEAGYVWPGYIDHVAEYTFHPNDALWDGRDCPPVSSCCSHHNPPYFIKSLNQTTTDDLELRMCLNDPLQYANVAVELVELYVK